MATTETNNHAGGVRRIPQRRDTAYQFPVYRWLSWITVAGYAVGLGCMYVLLGMFGIPAPIGWAALVVMFCAGIALLERPKALLITMLFYFLLMPGNRLLGLVGLPLPGFIDELFFIPFIAVIVMNLIQRTTMPPGLWFPASFMCVAAISWYVNGKPAPFTTVQVTLVLLKSAIIWYFCRMTCTFKDVSEFWKWGKLYIYYAGVQFIYNLLWQRKLWLTGGWDYSGGVFGPDGTGGAHIVGYISILALYLLAGWWAGERQRNARRTQYWMLFVGIVIAYDLAFMTDTKHALFLMPVAFAPILFHPSIAAKLRVGLLVGTSLVTVLGFMYVMSVLNSRQIANMLNTFVYSPKGEAYRAVTKDFHYLVPYPMFGAGPGRFFSQQAQEAGAPLARRYLIPYLDESARAKLTHTTAARTGSSLLMAPKSDALILMGEFGWAGIALYEGFLIWVFFSLWKKARQAPKHGLVFLALGAGLLFLSLCQWISPMGTVQPLVFPWWMMIGRIWDMPLSDGKADSPVEPTPGKALLSERP